MEYLNPLPSCSHQKLSLSIQNDLKMNKLWQRKLRNLLQVGYIQNFGPLKLLLDPLNLVLQSLKGPEKLSWTPWIVESALPLLNTLLHTLWTHYHHTKLDCFATSNLVLSVQSEEQSLFYSILKTSQHSQTPLIKSNMVFDQVPKHST